MAARRDELLVGGDDVFACEQGALRKFVRRAAAAHRLDDDGDLRVVFDDRKVVDDELFAGVAGKLALVEYIFDGHVLGRVARDGVRVFRDDLRNAAADSAVAADCYFCHC